MRAEAEELRHRLAAAEAALAAGGMACTQVGMCPHVPSHCRGLGELTGLRMRLMHRWLVETHISLPAASSLLLLPPAR